MWYLRIWKIFFYVLYLNMINIINMWSSLFLNLSSFYWRCLLYSNFHDNWSFEIYKTVYLNRFNYELWSPCLLWQSMNKTKFMFFDLFFFKVIQNRSSALSRKFWSLLFPFLFLFFPVYNFHLFIYSFICLSIRVSLCWQLLKERLKLKRKMKKPFVCSSFDLHFNTTHILYTNRIKILWFLSILVSKRFFFVLFSIWFVVLATVVVTMKQIMRNSEMYSL